MLKLKGYLKPFIGALLLAFVLLFVQAICDLNLPNLMSNIVNVGIQQGGVEDSTPRALSTQAREFLEAFMTDEQKRLLDDNYVLVKNTDAVEGGGAQGKTYGDLYPDAGDELYVLDTAIDEDTLLELDALFGTTTWTMVGTLRTVQQMNEEGTLKDTITQQIEAQLLEQINQKIDSGEITLPPGMEKDAFAQMILEQQMEQQINQLGDNSSYDSESTSGLSEDSDIREIDFKQVYQLLPLIELLPTHVIDDARSQAENMDPMLREQSGTMLVAAFYTELGMDMTQVEINYIVRIGLFMLLITLISGASTVLVGFLSARIGAGTARNLRHDIFAKVADFSHTEFDRFSTASLITRSTNDVTQIQMLLTMGIRMICYAPVLAIGATIMALQKSVSMSWIIGIAVLFMICVMIILFIILMPKFRLIQKLIDRLNLVAREALNGLMVIKAFGRGDFEKKRFDVANWDVTKTNLFIQRAMVFMMPVLMIFMNGLTVLIIWVGAHQVAASTMQVGDMMAYMQYAMMVVMGFMFIAMAFIFVPRASVSAGRIAEVLETNPVISDPEKPLLMDPAHIGRVEFRDVGFRFEGAQLNALCNISFVAKPGSTTAFIGSTGSGKSTILNLIARFYDATAGEVLVGGVNVKDMTQHELRSHLGYIPQKNVLLTGTIADNIAYGNPTLLPEDLVKVAEVAQALDFINEKEEGFDAEIAQGGSNVSGGQRQRLSIARALAVQPDIFLFDDSFSALDFKTDAQLRKALKAHTSKSTILIVAQRVSTIMDADMIYVIDDGIIVGRGTHSELLRSCPEYLEIASSQLSEEELAS